MSSALLPTEELATDAAALELWEEELRTEGLRVYRPTPKESLSEWADEHGRLSDGSKWSTDVVPYLREIMDTVTDRSVREIVVMKASRVGYTEGVLGQRIGYVIHRDPERILVVQPTKEDAHDWSQKQLAPMIRESPTLKGIVPEARGRTSGNTILDKVFPGGSITIRGAHSPKGLRRHTARDVILDEVDGFEVTSRDEGDPVMLATRACRTLPDRKLVMGSTPKVKEESRIWKALQGSDWREYHVACPSCDTYQALRWGGPGDDYGIKWAKEAFCKQCGAEAPEEAEECAECGTTEFEVTHLPETAYYLCEECGHHIEEYDKAELLANGRWVARFPNRKVRGYHISGLLSPFEGSNWENLVREFLRTKDDPALFQVWTNQWLGEPWEERGEKASLEHLKDRTEEWVDQEGKVVDVPAGVGVLTAAVDVHGSWLELLVEGWGHELESWDILHERIHGDPELDATWSRLEPLLTRAYRHQSGRELRIQCVMIDAGYATDKVYSWVRPREGRNVFAILGDRTGDPDHPPLRKPSKANSEGVRVWTAGTYKLKDALLRRLRVDTPGPRYIHFRAYNPARCNGFDAEYFAQFQAEKKVPRPVKGSRQVRWRFVQTRTRNEAIDLHVYNHAALLALGAGVRGQLAELARRASQTPDQETDQPAPKAKGGKRTRGRRGRGGRGGWTQGWK